MLNYISTFNDEYQKLFPAPATASSVVAPVATVSHPAESGAGVFDMFPTDKVPFNMAMFAFFGGNSADGTFTARATGWRKLGTLWIPEPLLTLSGVLGAMTGVAGTGVTASQLFADTITAVTVFKSLRYEINSPGGDQVATLLIDPCGCEYVQMQPAVDTCDSISVLGAGL